jgi:hypothetical protein
MWIEFLKLDSVTVQHDLDYLLKIKKCLLIVCGCDEYNIVWRQ